jgi:hypothetical protein
VDDDLLVLKYKKTERKRFNGCMISLAKFCHKYGVLLHNRHTKNIGKRER